MRFKKRIVLVSRNYIQLERELGRVGGLEIHGAGGAGNSYVDAGIGITGLREEDAGGRVTRVDVPFGILRRDSRDGEHRETQQEQQLRGGFHRDFRFAFLDLIVRLWPCSTQRSWALN